MRKHFYLVTEHEIDDRVGGVKIMDSRLSKPGKNEEAKIHKYDEEKGEFYTAGKHVHLGYADFADEDEYAATVGDVIQQKLADVDEKWVEKAGLSQEVVA